MFWVISAVLTALAATFIIVPVIRYRDRGPDDTTSSLEDASAEGLRRDTNVQLYESREEELSADLANGNIDQAAYDALILEMQQSLLSDVNVGGPDKSAIEKTGKQKKKTVSKATSRDFAFIKAIPLVLALTIPFLSYGLYSQWGYLKDVQLMGLFERTLANRDDPEEARSLIIELGKVVRDSDDGSGPNNVNDGNQWVWFFLGRNFSALGMFAEAESAFFQSSRRLDNDGEKAMVLGNYAMMMYANHGRQIDDEVQQVIDQARALSPNDYGILELLSIDAEFNGDYASAINYWRLLIQQNPNSPQARVFRQRISQAQTELAGTQGSDEVEGATVDVQIALAEGIVLNPNLRVFVAARNAEREGMPPLAARSLTVADLPTTVRLDASAAVGPFNLSSADSVYVSALISNAGVASPSSGDYRVVSETFSHNGQHAVISLVLSEQVP